MPSSNTSPTASFTTNTSSGSAPLDVNFDASSSNDTDGTITNYTWFFGDGTIASGSSATTSHTYPNTGNFVITLTVTDNKGAIGQTQTTITVTEKVVPTCTSFTYSGWSSCQTNGTQTRNVTTSSPTGCTGGDPVITQTCNYNSSSNG